MLMHCDRHEAGCTSVPPGPIDQEAFFTSLGFEKVHSLDVSTFEGATFAFDLNADPALLPASLSKAYDVVLNGGTLEHCFNIFHAIQTALMLVAEGGLFINISPMNNYVDHGFYQLSPTFFFDYAHANQWEVTESAAIRLELIEGRPVGSDIFPVFPGLFGTVGSLDNAPYLYYAVLRRTPQATTASVPLQRYYHVAHGNDVQPYGGFLAVPFHPYRIHT